MTEQPRGGRSGEVVLVCDDEPKLALLTAGLLEDHGLTCAIVHRGDDALRRLNDDVGVLLLDVNLADGPSALEVLDEMTRADSTIPTVLMSGFAPEDLPGRLTHHERVSGYLCKPYTADQLVGQIRGALRSAAAPAGTDLASEPSAHRPTT